MYVFKVPQNVQVSIGKLCFSWYEVITSLLRYKSILLNPRLEIGQHLLVTQVVPHSILTIGQATSLTKGARRRVDEDLLGMGNAYVFTHV